MIGKCKFCGKEIEGIFNKLSGHCRKCGKILGEIEEKIEELEDDEHTSFTHDESEDGDGFVISIDKYKLLIPYSKLLKKFKGKKITTDALQEFIELERETDKIKKQDRKNKIREKAEKQYYGKVKSERTLIKDKEEIFRRFENKCAVCGEMEGLHIHHKDKDATNNSADNLIVLCGVCHKKIHMKVR